MAKAVTAARHESSTPNNMVLVVLQDGSVQSVLEAPEKLRSNAAPSKSTSLNDLWSPTLAQKIRQDVKRTLRNRRVHHSEAEDPASGCIYEIISVPQGRDRVLLVARDISTSDDALTRVRQLAFTDPLTALPNRQFLFTELRKITDELCLKEGRAAVICIHIDPLDDDRHVLIAGQEDAIIKELATRLAVHLRGMNAPGEISYERYSVLARTDFRQFTIVLPSIDTGQDAESVVIRLLDELTQPVALGTRSIVATANAGVALFPQDGKDPETLYTNADVAMEDARNSVSDSYRFHTGTVRLRNLQRQDLACDLKAAFDRGDFTLGFLPVVDAQTGEVNCVEALLRWPTNILGSRSTRQVVAIAEYTGLIVDIGDWVLRRSCELLKKIHAGGQTGVRLAVNLSTQELSRPDLAMRVEAILAEEEVDAAALDFEINEAMLYRDALHEHSVCNELASLGARIVIDDYGTGACTLAHLAQSAVSGIKIDASFVANIEASEQDRAACRATIAFAHGLGLPVTAEGVETEAQASFLRDNGCDLLQGFLVSKPLAEDAVLPFLENRTNMIDASEVAS